MLLPMTTSDGEKRSIQLGRCRSPLSLAEGGGNNVAVEKVDSQIDAAAVANASSSTTDVPEDVPEKKHPRDEEEKTNQDGDGAQVENTEGELPASKKQKLEGEENET